MAGMLFEAIPRGVELGEPVQPPRSDSGGAFDDLPDLLSDCLNPPSLHSDVSEGQLCQVAQAPSIAAEPVATWVAGQYLVRRDLQIGRTGLLVAFDTSVAPAVQLSAKSIDASAMKGYLAKEGTAWATLRQAPHRNIPPLVGSYDPTTESEPGYLFFPAFHADIEAESHMMPTLAAGRDVSAALGVARQLTAAVAHCHSQRVVLPTGLDLSRFMWADPARTTVHLASLDGAEVLPPAESTLELPTLAATPSTPPERLELGVGVAAGHRRRVVVVDPFAADVYALGVAVHTLVVGEAPFSGDTPRELAAQIRAGVLGLPSLLPVAVAELLLAMLAPDPADRITAAEALEHRAFTDRRHWLGFGRALSAPAESPSLRRYVSCPSVADPTSAAAAGGGGGGVTPANGWAGLGRRREKRRGSAPWVRPRAEIGVAVVPDAAAAAGGRGGRQMVKRSSLCSELDELDLERIKRRSSLY